MNTRLRPGVRLLVTFAGDPGFFHERIVGGESFKGEVFVATSGGHEYFEQVKNWRAAWLVSGASRYPADLEGEILSFTVPWTNAQMQGFAKRGRHAVKQAREAEPSRTPGRDFEKVYDWEGEELPIPADGFVDGVRRRLRGKAPRAAPPLPIREEAADEPATAADGPPLPGPAGDPVEFDPGDGFAWVICEVSAAAAAQGFEPHFGALVNLKPGSVVLGDRAIYEHTAGVFVCCRKLSYGDVPSLIRKARDALLEIDPKPDPDPAKAPEPAKGVDLRDRLNLGGGAAAGAAPAPGPVDGAPIDGGPAAPPSDFRVLPVDYDDQGVRYKPFRTAVSEARDGSKYKDWPFLTEGAALNMLKHFERHGGNCLLWLDKWMASKGVEAGERTGIEMAVHMRTLHYLSTYDQLNMGAIAGAENVILRVAQIIEAYRTDPKRPNWASVKHIAATDDAMDPIPSSLRTYNAKLTKEEVEAENLRLRMRGLRPSHAPDDADDGLPKATATRPPKAKGKAKGGLAPPNP